MFIDYYYTWIYLLRDNIVPKWARRTKSLDVLLLRAPTTSATHMSHTTMSYAGKWVMTT
jgi:hypothetical protein